MIAQLIVRARGFNFIKLIGPTIDVCFIVISLYFAVPGFEKLVDILSDSQVVVSAKLIDIGIVWLIAGLLFAVCLSILFRYSVGSFPTLLIISLFLSQLTVLGLLGSEEEYTICMLIYIGFRLLTKVMKF